jgi:hypothetical protein
MSNYPKLICFTTEEKEIDEVNHLTNILDTFSFDPTKGCLICANAMKDGDVVYLNRKGEIYHQICYVNASNPCK